MADDLVPVAAKQGKYEYALYFTTRDNDEIAASFKALYGYSPDIIITTGGGKLAGPIGGAYLEGDKDADN